MAAYFEVGIYLIGSLSNIILLYVCCKKDNWRHFDNTKYLVAAQAVFSLLPILSAVGLIYVEYLPERFCSLLPQTMIIGLALALFNLTFLAIVKHAQLTSKWKLRHSSAILIVVAVFAFSVALLSPVLYTSAVGLPIVIIGKGPGCPDITTAKDTANGLLSIPAMNVISYGSVYLTLQFIIPGIIIINRLVLVGHYFWRSDSEENVQSKPCCILLEMATNTISALVVVVVCVCLLAPRKHSEPMASLNKIFDELVIVSMAVLCLPCVFWITILCTSKESKAICDNLAGTTAVELNDKPWEKSIMIG
ncbi:hypothetical protein QZH41_007190 [Actinostola sp. cb2023]|nr:hypothetical protein QZH41_007190 [Actinostola sp. cb2023]